MTQTSTAVLEHAPAVPGARLSAANITVGYGEEPVVHDVSLHVPDGKVTTIIGPNGCGKSTLLRTLSRLLSPSSGQVTLDGAPIGARSAKELARTLALLPQCPLAPEGLLVRDLVGRGRHPHQRWFQQWSHGDEDIVTDAMRWTGILDLADRPVDALSGGQRQRVWIAMTLAQHTDLVLLDEPTTYLDLAHQVDVLDLVCRLNRERGATVAMVLHDLNLAVRFSDHLVVMHHGCVVAQGDPVEVIDADLLQQVFGLDSDIVADPRTGIPTVVPRGRKSQAG
ncbi:iron-enterobactin transporter ATP-binding protein [Flexivirga endophytica]|uniref:Iron-enterobactin transporter ATP-binding protein n=1 Tax=Flexivirga endophytica TaxID=1849103 RepID=A0A916STS6_9MICO|nr:ABC transporter ATP-binding protein [Flexivirga endophytica]GGB17649.1 iron-enterobactin transporter ATP-binding protein [Flexivirga endophytica]GHB37998.1 iron-enterobactin transporter ATP-binding protein [Flexivirga endophytica]